MHARIAASLHASAAAVALCAAAHAWAHASAHVAPQSAKPAVEFPPKAAAAQPSGKQQTTRAPANARVVRGPQGAWQVTLTLDARTAGAAKRVNIAGGFNGWQVGANDMEKLPDGSYVVTVDMNSGVQSYKFVLDGTRWIADPANLDSEDDGHGGRNSLLRLGPEAALEPSFSKGGDGQVEGAALVHDVRGQRDRQRAGDAWVIRYRTLRGDVQGVDMVWRRGVQIAQTPMARIAQQGPFDVWEAQVSAAPGKMAYTFLVKDGPLTVRDPKTYSLDAENAAAFRTPDWAKNAIWYQVMVDRFRDGNTGNNPPHTVPWTLDWDKPAGDEGKDGQTYYRHFVFDRFGGGDLAGLRAKLPYLKDLGVNALYLMPMFQATTPHKYNATNLVHIDQHFGAGNDYEAAAATEDISKPETWKFTPSDKEFLEFLAEAKKQGFRVIIDGVFNHVGTGHPAFQDVKNNGAKSRFADWFDIRSWDPFTYDAWWGFSELPVFKKDPQTGLASAGVRKHIMDITRRWMDPNGDGNPNDGVDGWRLDVPNEVPLPFWKEWRAAVKSINPEAYISGEIWDRADQYLDGNAFDAVMNYEFAKAAVAWVGNRTKKPKASEFDRMLAEVRVAYPAEAHYCLMNLLDSHDTDRVSSMLKNPDRAYNQQNRMQQEGVTYDPSKPTDAEYDRQRLLALLQMTYVGAPMIYYGDEVGMWGASDPNNRKPMLWQDLVPYQNAQDAPDLKLLQFYQRAIALRRDNPALRTGSFRTVLADDAQDVLAFVREGGGQQVLVALNASDKSAHVQFPELDAGGGWKCVWGDIPPAEKGVSAVTVAPISGRVWVRTVKP